MRRLLLVAAALLTGCNALSANLVLTATALPWDSSRPYPPLQCTDCDVEKTEADELAERVPVLMEKSRERAGPDAKVTRTGYFSWQVSSPRVVAQCNVGRGRWKCDRALGVEFSQQL